MKIFITIFLLVSTTITFAQNNYMERSRAESHIERFRAEEASITKAAADGKIKTSEAAKEVLLASKVYFPNDTLTHAYYESVLSYAERMEKKEITSDQALELLDIRTKRFYEALQARSKEQESQRIAQAQENARLAEIADAERREYARRQAVGNMLQGVGNAFRNSNGGGTNCTTSMYGNQAFTNCR